MRITQAQTQCIQEKFKFQGLEKRKLEVDFNQDASAGTKQALQKIITAIRKRFGRQTKIAKLRDELILTVRLRKQPVGCGMNGLGSIAAQRK